MKISEKNSGFPVLGEYEKYIVLEWVEKKIYHFCFEVLMKLIYQIPVHFLTLSAPTPQNGQTQTIRRQFANDFFECV